MPPTRARGSGFNGFCSRICWMSVFMILFAFPLMGMKVGVAVLDQDRNAIINITLFIQFDVLMQMGVLNADRVGDQEPGGCSH